MSLPSPEWGCFILIVPVHLTEKICVSPRGDEGYSVVQGSELGPRRSGWTSRRAAAALVSVFALAAVRAIPHRAPSFWTSLDAP